MSTSNNNWRQTNTDRRVNLAMTAELALGGGSGRGIGGGVPRNRGNDNQNGPSNDILGTYLSSQKPSFGSGSNNIGFGKDTSSNNAGEFGSNWQVNRGYNPENEFSSGTNTFGNYQNSYGAVSKDQSSAESNGFKVQRVRGGFGKGQINEDNSHQQQQTTGLNLNKQMNISDGSDIDYKTNQIKKEIDSLDQQLNNKHQFIPLSNPNNNNVAFGINNNNQGIGNAFTHKNSYEQVQSHMKLDGTTSTALSSSSNNKDQSQSTASSSGGSSIRLPPKPMNNNINNSSNSNNNVLSQTISSSTNNNIQFDKKEFLTGTYDPSNILGGNRQGRMRSLGRGKPEPANQHEEKAAQATGNKALPDQIVQVEQFQCPEGCGRSFNKKALEKHIPICKKLFQTKKPDKKPEPNPTEELANNTKQAPKPPKQKVQGDQTTATMKSEALKKLKEQKKKELSEMNNKEEQKEQHVINDANEGDYI